jgi:hypothetical protein
MGGFLVAHRPIYAIYAILQLLYPLRPLISRTRYEVGQPPRRTSGTLRYRLAEVLTGQVRRGGGRITTPYYGEAGITPEGSER